MGDQRSLVTVIGDRKRVDVALPSGAPVGEYAARLADMVGQDGHDVFPPEWSLTYAGGAPLALEQTLAEVGIVDGAVLYLIDIAGDPGGAPAIEDIEELVADETAQYRDRQPPRGLIVVALALVWLVAASLVLLRLKPGTVGVILLTLAAFGLLGTSWALQQRDSPVPATLRLAMSLSSAVCLAAAGGLVVPQMSGGLWWVGAVAGANLGIIMALSATPEIILLAVEVQLLVGALLLPLFLSLRTTGPQAAAALTVAAIALLGGSKWMAASISAWASRSPADPKSKTPKAQAVTLLLVKTQRVLAVVVAVPTIALAVCMPVLALAHNWFALILATTTATGLLVRAKQSGFASETVFYATGGLVGLFAVFGTAGQWFGGSGVAAIALTAGGIGVLLVGLTVTFVQLPLTESTSDVALGGAAAPGRRSAAEVIGMLCNLAAAPLAMGVFGVYGELSAMGHGMV